MLLHAAATMKKQQLTTPQGASSLQYDARAALKNKVPNELEEDNEGESEDDEDDNKTLKNKADKAKNVQKEESRMIYSWTHKSRTWTQFTTGL